MSARRVEGEMSRAAAAFERSIALDPNRPDTLYNYANLLKDDQPDRAVQIYQRSLFLEPSAAAVAQLWIDSHKFKPVSECFVCLEIEFNP